MGSRPQEDDLAEIEDDDAPFEEDEDGGSVSLGWAFHAMMSAKARLWRLLTLAYSSLVASAPAPRQLSFERHEPSLGRAGPSLAPRADEELDEAEEDEEEEEEEPSARAPRKKPAAARAPRANPPTVSSCRRFPC